MKKSGINYISLTVIACFFIFIILFVQTKFQRMSKSNSLEENVKSNELGKLPSDGGPDYNRLIFEKSPYLLQHAQNPVDWYPWTEEAFLKAKKEDKPVFLSIGYSACHWCQVMERESFEDTEVATLINKNFIAIKVDREERPDIDNIYMTVCQSMTGSGGWPLTIIMTPDKKPFFAGTYFPKHTKYGRSGLMDILSQITSLWETDRKQLLKVGDQVTEIVQNLASPSSSGKLTNKTLEEAYEHFQNDFDELYGGFGAAPKFPSPHNLSFLLRWWNRSNDKKALEMIEKTLDAMWHGGMYDHLGFGFHRYSTDRRWLVPHFEKMLYDQAMLGIAYTETYQATGKKQYADIAEQIFTYVLRDMTSPEGAFYSSENADSEGEEGKFYVWTQEEVKKILPGQQGEVFCKFYGVTKKGVLEGGKNILHITKTPEEFSREEGIKLEELHNNLEQSRQKLFAARKQRIHPSKDDKILTDWNGLMIVSLARGAQVLNKPEYANAASSAADFLLQNLRRKDGRLLHRYREGEAGQLGFIDDYAFLIWGLLELYEATFNVKYLNEALILTDDMNKLFWDENEKGFFFTGEDNEKLIARMKKFFDGAVPSGNSVAALDLLILGHITTNEKLSKKAEQLMESLGGTINQSPRGFSQLLISLDFSIGPTKEIVIAGELHNEDTKQMLRKLHSRFIPRKIIILHPEGEDAKTIEKIVPFVEFQNKIDGKATAYVCENYSCKSPTTDIAEMISLVESK